MRYYDFIAKNEKTIKRLLRNGGFSYSTFNQYLIYKDYLMFKSSVPKMDRYSFLSEKHNVKERTVRNAIKNMEKRIS